MSIKDYRRQLEQRVAEASALGEAGGGPELLGIASDGETAALGRVVRKDDPSTAHPAPLERLADPNEAPSVRLAALGLLKQLAISSPTFAEWRPAFLEALRRAVSEPELRAAALEVLTQSQDRFTQEELLAGLRDSARALVPAEQALRLLSSDPHADVRDVARSVAAEPPNDATLLQAMKILAGDPGWVGGFSSLLGDDSQSISVRKMAATALNNLAPELLPAAMDQQRQAAAEGGGIATLGAANDDPALAATMDESAPARGEDEIALEKHIGALLRVRSEPGVR